MRDESALEDLQDQPANGEDEDEEGILSTPVVFFDTAGCEYFERTDGDSDEGCKCNENEATVVKNWVEKLVSTPDTVWRTLHFSFKHLAG